MSDTIRTYCEDSYKSMVQFRRDIHKHPERPCLEYRTASTVICELRRLGYEVHYGPEVMNLNVVKNILPTQEEGDAAMRQAIDEGADPNLVAEMKYHNTAVVGILRCGEGPVIGLRADMDALNVIESQSPSHVPNKEGFSSIHPNISHACGHDAHTAMGLAIASVMKRLADAGEIHGTLKLFFQPGEESTIGGHAMCEAGVADDVDDLIAIHVGVGTKKTGQIGATAIDFPALRKYAVHYEGLTSHSGVAPEKGKNALLAACHAILGIYGLPRHSKGWSRVNVGIMNSGIVSNGVPGFSDLVVELRASNDEVMDRLDECAQNVLKGAAIMYNCEVDILDKGINVGAPCDSEMIDLLRTATAEIPEVTEFLPEVSMSGAGEDATRFMRKVQSHGGKATYMMIGSDLSTAPHTDKFDVDEKAMAIGLETVVRAFYNLMK